MQNSPIALVLILCCFFFSSSFSDTIWVSEQGGDDLNNGTKTSPLKTLQGALNFAQNKSILTIEICLFGNQVINGTVNFSTLHFNSLNITGCEETQSSLSYEVTSTYSKQALGVVVFANLRVKLSGQNFLIGDGITSLTELVILHVTFTIDDDTSLATSSSILVIQDSVFMGSAIFSLSEYLVMDSSSCYGPVIFLGIRTTTLNFINSNFTGISPLDSFAPSPAILINSFFSLSFKNTNFSDNKAGIQIETFGPSTISMSNVIIENNYAIGTSLITLTIPEYITLKVDSSSIGCNSGPLGSPIRLFPQGLYNNLEVWNTSSHCDHPNPPTPEINGTECSFLGACRTCPAGYYSFNNTCLACSPGTFSYQSGSSICLPCVGNSYSLSEANICLPCHSEFANENHTSCVSAPSSPLPPTLAPTKDSTYLTLLFVVNIVFFLLVIILLFLTWNAKRSRHEFYGNL